MCFFLFTVNWRNHYWFCHSIMSLICWKYVIFSCPMLGKWSCASDVFYSYSGIAYLLHCCHGKMNIDGTCICYLPRVHHGQVSMNSNLLPVLDNLRKVAQQRVLDLKVFFYRCFNFMTCVAFFHRMFVVGYDWIQPGWFTIHATGGWGQGGCIPVCRRYGQV